MDQPLQPASPAMPQAPLWLRALGYLIEPWIRIQRQPAEPRAQYDLARPVCYVTERYGLSDTLILEQAFREAGLPEPLRPFEFGGMKALFAVYGLQMDKALDSVKAETVSTTGDSAKVKVSYTAFDQPFTTESELAKVDGKWYSKQAIDQWKKQHETAQIAPAASEPAATSK